MTAAAPSGWIWDFENGVFVLRDPRGRLRISCWPCSTQPPATGGWYWFIQNGCRGRAETLEQACLAAMDSAGFRPTARASLLALVSNAIEFATDSDLMGPR
ncbi:hypothetical protein F2P47_06660 [Parvibaculum sedimenti]|uniref:Uncharacterized protein n=1 Tax=Parvibaculum sedimenti TaxID=2608632 RepID=A0A6N6VNJ5_9HYPH|nr:hypothetical protein [Parvibaculum sedimenti]KAB7740722.1 hypothetical protein F2P47_06660 [Parvibaculum sedimenti]